MRKRQCGLSSETDRGKDVHLAHRITTIRRVIIAKLTTRVPAPTFDGMVVQKGAGVPTVCGNLQRCSAGGKIDRRQGGHFSGAVTAEFAIIKAERSPFIESPAFDASIVQQGTGVERPGGDLSNLTAKIQRSERCHVAGLFSSVLRVVVTQLPSAIPTPTFNGVVVEQGARVKITRRDLPGSPIDSEVEGTEGSHFSRIVATVAGVVVSELSGFVMPPAFYMAVVE